MPPESNDTADCLEHISDLYYNLGTYDKALKYRSSHHPMITLSLQWIGRIYSNMKNDPQALDYFKRAAQIYKASYVPEYEKIEETQQYIDEIENKLNETISSVQVCIQSFKSSRLDNKHIRTIWNVIFVIYVLV